MCIRDRSKAYKELDNKITAIADYIFNHFDEYKTDEDEIWGDSYEVCTFLKISDRTLQRLRAAGMISYSDIKGHYLYKICLLYTSFLFTYSRIIASIIGFTSNLSV